jgi:hypothetical protein
MGTFDWSGTGDQIEKCLIVYDHLVVDPP